MKDIRTSGIGDVLHVLVHPGSLCGSADFSLTEAVADAKRNAIANELDRHEGHLLVIDGELTAELGDRPELASAIERCLSRCTGNGRICERVVGLDDPDDDREHFTQSLVPILERIGQAVGWETEVVVTGAWYEEDHSSGCVTAVVEMLLAAGFERVVVSETVMSLDDGPVEIATPPSPRL
jgi:hypothetical protein